MKNRSNFVLFFTCVMSKQKMKGKKVKMCVCSLSDAMGLTPCGVCARDIDSFHLNFFFAFGRFVYFCLHTVYDTIFSSYPVCYELLS